MYCKIKNCGDTTSGKSKYCAEHKKIARQRWLENVQRQAADREALNAKFKEAFDNAHERGLLAGETCVPEPMYIKGYAPVLEGVCGFAWIKISPGNCKAANYAKKHLGAGSAYGGGVSIGVSYFGQSYERKKAYARAYADSLSKSLEALDPRASVYPGGRLD